MYVYPSTYISTFAPLLLESKECSSASWNYFLYPRSIDADSYSFWPVRLSVRLSAETCTLAISFDW